MTPEQERQALHRVRAGEGVRTIAADLGVSHMAVYRLSRRAKAKGAQAIQDDAQRAKAAPQSACSPTYAVPASVLEHIDAVRSETIEVLRSALLTQDKGSDLAAVANALRGLLVDQAKAKQIAAAQGDDTEGMQSVAAQVRERLQRLSASKSVATPVAEPAAEPEADTGT